METSNNINNGKNEIFIKGSYDCEGGVEDLVVTKVEKFAPYGALDYTRTVIFKGDISKLSASDDPSEIKSVLESRFSEEGFTIKFSIH